jgi:hypothetical protein
MHTDKRTEILERLHENITLNQAKNFDILKQQQEYLVSWREEEVHTLDQLKGSQKQLLDQMQVVQKTHLKTANQIQSIFETLVLLQNQTEAAMFKYNQLVQYRLQTLTTQLNQLVLQQEAEISHILDSVHSALEIVDQRLADMIIAQQEAIDHWNETKVSRLIPIRFIFITSY